MNKNFRDLIPHKTVAVARAWERGDLVKIKASTWGGRANDAFGVLVGIVGENNSNLFPRAFVYDIVHQKIEQIYLYDLELLSSAT